MEVVIRRYLATNFRHCRKSRDVDSAGIAIEHIKFPNSQNPNIPSARDPIQLTVITSLVYNVRFINPPNAWEAIYPPARQCSVLCHSNHVRLQVR